MFLRMAFRGWKVFGVFEKCAPAQWLAHPTGEMDMFVQVIGI